MYLIVIKKSVCSFLFSSSLVDFQSKHCLNKNVVNRNKWALVKIHFNQANFYCDLTIENLSNLSNYYKQKIT